MKIRVSHLPYLALALGAAGSGLRRVQLSTGFEPDTGLARLDSWINPLLPLFLAAEGPRFSWKWAARTRASRAA